MNPNMEQLGDVDLPIGKYYLSAYKYALQQYILFLESGDNAV